MEIQHYERMTNSSQRRGLDYQRAGHRLGQFIRSKNPSIQQMQGMLADLLGDDELLLTIRDVISRPVFSPLRDLAGSGKGAIERHALLQELGKSYLPKIVDSVGLLISGMLETAEEGKVQVEERNPRPTIVSVPDQLAAASNRVDKKEASYSSFSDPWTAEIRVTSPSPGDAGGESQHVADSEKPKRLSPSDICDENLWNSTRDPEIDKAFLKAWNLRWFNRNYRPRLEDE